MPVGRCGPIIPLIFYCAGPLCPRYGAVPLQRRQHDGFPHPQHRKLSGVIHHREVVDGAAAGAAQARLGPAGRLHDGRNNWALVPLLLALGVSCPSRVQ